MNRKSSSVGFIRTGVCCFIFLTGWLHPCPAQMKITLDQALEFALENSPEIRRTRLDLERSSQLLKARQAALKSHFSLTLTPFSYNSDRTFNRFFSAWSTSKTKQSQSIFTISQPIEWTDGTLSLINRFSWQDSYSDFKNIRNKQYSNNLYLSFNQPIFTYNRTKLETRELELNLEQTELNYAIQKLVLEREVSQSFYNAYESKMSLDIALQEQKNQENSYRIIKNKVDAGLAALEELYQAELNLATSKSTVQNRQVALENALDSFKQLIGMPLTEQITLEADLSYRIVEVDLDKALETALENRLELRRHKINIENARFDLIRTSAQNEFKGDITLSYGIIGTDERFGDLYEKPTKRQTVELSIDIPLWDWGEKRSRIRASEATVEREKLSYEDETVNISLEIRRTWRQLKNLVSQIEIARQNVRNAELTYEINLERYKYGDLTSMDLNLFQNQLSQKKMQLVSALVDYKLALLDLKIQTLWDFERNQPVLP